MPALAVQMLEKRFGATAVVSGVSLTVERGAIYGLLGPNGAGKTTTLACALGLMRPTAGTSFVLGEPARRVARWRGRVGVVFDRPVLVPGLTARANLEYARRLSGGRDGRGPDEVLARVGLGEHAARRARVLSLGQARRLSIAMALLGRPELLVLDEPLSGLDPLGVRAMLALFRALAEEGTTLLLSSHRLHEMETVITHAAILLAGRVEREGSLAALLGEEAARVELECHPRARAQEILRRLPGAVDETGPGADGVLRVRLDGTSGAALNRALVEGGCDVSRLAPVRASLATAFARIVDARAAAEGEA